MRHAPAGRFRRGLRTLSRWYAAAFLAVFMILGVIGVEAVTFYGDELAGLTERWSGP